MAGSGAKLFENGDILQADDVNNYLMLQSIMRFATTTARDTALGVGGEFPLSEGLVCYVDATDKLYVYTGSPLAWAEVASEIANDAVTTAKIANAAVTEAKLASNAVTTAKIADGAITSAKIGAGTIDDVSATSYTLALADLSKTKKFTAATAVTVTIPTNASVAFGVGSEIYFLQYGVGQVTFAGATGVTIVSDDGRLKIKSRYSSASLLKLDTNEWVLTGNLAA